MFLHIYKNKKIITETNHASTLPNIFNLRYNVVKKKIYESKKS